MDLENLYLIKQHLGMIAFSLEKYKDAEVLLRQVEDYLVNQKTEETDVLRISHVILRLAEIYENLNNFE